MEKSKIKIYISCHKDCYVPNHPLLFPIQVGAEKAAKRFDNMLHDDEGQNISSKNPMYCELTAQYWAWKNDLDVDYYGFFHYRRYMSFSDETFETNLFQDAEMDYLDDSVFEKLNLSESHMRDVIGKYDIIATTPVKLKKLNRILDSNYTQYAITPYQYAEDLEVMLDIIKEKYPDYYDTAIYYLKESPIGYYCNMFIMKKELFQEYSEWLFTILEEHEKRRDYHDYSVMGYRVSGYLAERLFGIYYMHLQKSGEYKYCDLQRTLFKNVDKHPEFAPAFSENNIAIALAANNFFIPYTATTMQSIIENRSDKYNYDILLLTSDTSDENKKLLLNMVKNCDNVSLRFLNPQYLLYSYKLFTRGHFSVETYYRLVLPEMLQQYHKILYLDSDMVIEHDVAELYNTDLTNYLLAACYDADTAGLYNGYEPKKKEYTDHVLQLKKPYNYFQAGTILMNLDEFRKTYTTEEILEFSAKEKWQLLDQDILNKLCEDRVKYIDMRWNVLVDYADIRIKDIISLAPQWLNKAYMKSRKDPYIIHYAGPDKPWYRPDIDMGTYFWKYARHTPFYELIIQRMSIAVSSWSTGKSHNNLVLGGLQCILDHGIGYTIKYIPKRMGWKK